MSPRQGASSEPERLTSGASEDPVLVRVGALARELPEPRALSDAALERVLYRLRGSPVGLGGLSTRRLLVVLAVLAVATAAVGRYALSSVRERAAVVPAVVAPTASVAVKTLAPRSPPGVARAPAPEAPVAVAPPVALPPAAPAAPVAASSAPESRLAAESKALEPAIVALRRERDAARSLALVERYEAEFPHGVLALEARVVRIDALLALGRRPDALVLLQALPLERVGRGVELRLVRAELRAGGDCGAALADFDRVLATAPAAGLEERALRGRSLCRASRGDAAGARSDADRYLAKYPAGRFAAELQSVGTARP